MTVELHVEVTRPGRGHVVAKCERGYQGVCKWSIWNRPATGSMWHWDGNVEKPTISPSIDCQGGCGRHFTVTNGIATP